MKYRATIIFLFALMVFIFTAGPALAVDPAIAVLNERLGLEAQKIASWKLCARILITLTIVTGILGALIGSLHYAKSNKAKAVTSVAGVVVSILTVIMNAAFPADYRTYNKVVEDAQQVLSEIQLQLAQISEINDPIQKRKLINDVVLNRFKKITELSKTIYASNRTISIPDETAWAGEQVPEWVQNPPRDDDSFYFVGSADSADLTIAEKKSLTDAQSKAKAFLADLLAKSQPGVKVRPDNSIVNSIVNIADRANGFVQIMEGRNAAGRSYRYYTLLKIDKETAKMNTRIEEKRRNLKIPDKFIVHLGVQK